MSIALHWRILIGLVLGVVVGVAVNLAWSPSSWASLGVQDAAAYLAGRASEANANAGASAWLVRFLVEAVDFVGDLFIRCLRFIAVPIVLFSLIVGASSLNDLKKLGRIGGKTVAIYVLTTAVSISVGLLLANIIQPGSARFVPEETRSVLAASQADAAVAKIERAQSPSTWDVFLDIVPKNPFEALARGEMLQVVFFALVLGIALTLVRPEKARVVVDFCDGMTEAIIKLVDLIMLAAPYAVFALLVKVVAALGLDVLGALLAYSLVVITGLLIMMLGLYPLVLALFTPVRYTRFFSAIAPAQLLAFSSSSSSATLPVTMECAEERLGVSEEVTSFVLPLGATINMDGTALYQGVATVFIAQMFGMNLDLGDQLTIVLTATLASIGTAGVPGVGLLMLIIVMEALQFPPEVMTTGIAVILGVDRVLDMCRTTCNVTGDAMVATLIASSEGDLLSESEVADRLATKRARGFDEHPPSANPASIHR